MFVVYGQNAGMPNKPFKVRQKRGYLERGDEVEASFSLEKSALAGL